MAASGTPLFVSVDPVKISDEVRTTMRDAMRLALSGGVSGGIEPLDWLQTTCPRQWCVGTRIREFDWIDTMGAWPIK